MTHCTVEAKILPLAGLAGHLYIEVFDETGQRICQVNGFAVDRKTDKTRSVGWPGDGLRAYTDRVLAASSGATRDRHPHRGAVLFRGSRADTDRVIGAFQKRIAEMNAADLPYKVLSINTNTVFAEMVSAMATVVPTDLAAAARLAKSKKLVPGFGADFRKAARNPPAPKAAKKKRFFHIFK